MTTELNGAKVLPFTGVTRLNSPPEKVIGDAEEASLTDVVVIGYDADGDLYFASSVADGPEVLWLLELAKKRLLEVGDPDDPA